MWYQKAASLDDEDAQDTLGYCYINDRGVPKSSKNNEIGFEWHKKAAMRGHANAQYNLGLCYQQGTGTSVNQSEAIKWFKKAALQGHKNAQKELNTYPKEEPEVEKDNKEVKPKKRLIRLSKLKKHQSKENEIKESSSLSTSTSKKMIESTSSKEGIGFTGDHLELPNKDKSLVTTSGERKPVAPKIIIPSSPAHTTPVFTEDPSALSTSAPTSTVLKPSTTNLSISTKNTTSVAVSSTELTHSTTSSSIRSTNTQKKRRIPKIDPSKKQLPTSLDTTKTPENLRIPMASIPEVPSVMIAKKNNKRKLLEEDKPPSALEFAPTDPLPKLFKPKVKQDQIAALGYSTDRFFNAVLKRKEYSQSTDSLFSPHKDKKKTKPKSTLTQEAKDQIGIWGEKYVFEMLQKHYLAKYIGATVKLTQEGFVLNGKNKNGAAVEVVVTWYNKEEETGAPLDLKLTKTRDGKLVKTRYIEVKTTEADKTHTTIAHFPASEVQTMLEYKEKYSIFRVYNAGKEDPKPRIEKIKNPLQKLVDGELTVDSLNLKV